MLERGTVSERCLPFRFRLSRVWTRIVDSLIHAIVCASRNEETWGLSKSWTIWIVYSMVETSLTNSSHLRSSLSPERNLDKTTASDSLSHLTRNWSNFLMYSDIDRLPWFKHCYWSSRLICMARAGASLGVSSPSHPKSEWPLNF